MKLFEVFNYRRRINRIVTLLLCRLQPAYLMVLVLLISEPDFKKEIQNIFPNLR